jgi:lipoprotein-anchoring transpeptidase ErfK/SrfK
VNVITTRPGLRRVAALLGATAAAALLAGCQVADAGTQDAAPRPTITTPTYAEAAVVVTPADSASDVRPDAPVEVSVTDGSVVDVTVAPAGSGDGADADQTAAGTEQAAAVTAVEGIQGVAGPGRRTWTSTEALDVGTRYQVQVETVDGAGRRETHTSWFTTLTPEDTAEVSILPRDGWTVGVGMPVIVSFDEDVENRAAVEKRLSVSTEPALEGAWRWESDRQVQWRPREFWPSGATATVAADLDGVEVAPGVWGTDDDEVTFEVGSAMVSTVDVDDHTMTVRRNGEVLRTIPITTGKDGFETRNGTKVIISRETEHRMDAATTGISKDDPEYYDVVVEYAMRLTWSGEFIHAAPWSVGQQGSANVSHGCTGLSTADAKWMFDHSKVGDVVQFVDSARPLEWGNGYTAWNMDFDRWAQGSALS